MKKILVALLIVVVITLATVWWRIALRRPRTLTISRGVGGVMTITITGDSLLLKPINFSQKDRPLKGIVNTLQGASLVLTNLEENLLDASNVHEATPGGPHWPHGIQRAAEDLKHIGITFVSLANDHAFDYGADGLKQTERILDNVHLLHAGAGNDLAQARAPVYTGKAPYRLAVIALTTSATAEARATYARGEIIGRPGVSGLRYIVDTTVDAAEFAALKQSAIQMEIASSSDGKHLTLKGTPIRITKGPRRAAEVVADSRDLVDILQQIKTARLNTSVVVVTLHNRQPDNRTQIPEAFEQRFAHEAIDAGASLVVEHGIHHLRGIELYKRGAIFYSLGNFVFDHSGVDPRAAAAYDGGLNLYGQASSKENTNSSQAPSGDEEWEGVIATTTFDHGVARSIRLQPIDLGVDFGPGQQGIPRLAAPERSKKILQRLVALSSGFHTAIQFENGVGVIDLSGLEPLSLPH